MLLYPYRGIYTLKIIEVTRPSLFFFSKTVPIYEIHYEDTKIFSFEDYDEAWMFLIALRTGHEVGFYDYERASILTEQRNEKNNQENTRQSESNQEK
jgi:hypothetical protein